MFHTCFGNCQMGYEVGVKTMTDVYQEVVLKHHLGNTFFFYMKSRVKNKILCLFLINFMKSRPPFSLKGHGRKRRARYLSIERTQRSEKIKRQTFQFCHNDKRKSTNCIKYKTVVVVKNIIHFCTI